MVLLLAGCGSAEPARVMPSSRGAGLSVTGRLTLTSPMPQTEARFGTTIVDVGDVDGDGQADLAVVARDTEFVGAGSYAGRVFVMSGSNGAHLFTLDNPEPQAETNPTLWYAYSVRATGDLDGDGRSEIAIGSPGFDNGVYADQGRIYLFRGADGGLLRTIADTMTSHSARFGEQMALIADTDGDGASDIGVSHIGTHEIQVVSSANGALLRRLTNPGHPSPTLGGFFGWEMTELGDLDDDGKGDLAVSAPFNEVTRNGASVLGAGQVFLLSSTGTVLAILEDPEPQVTDNDQYEAYGFSMAPVHDFDGDGALELAIGANGARGVVVSTSPSSRGAVLYTLELPPAYRNWFMDEIVPVPDLDCDGVGDIAASVRGGCPGVDGELHFFSGRDGTLFHSLKPRFATGSQLGISMTLLGRPAIDGGFDLGVAASALDVQEYATAGWVFVYRVRPTCGGTATPDGGTPDDDFTARSPADP
jgi:hypothetical protein